MIFSWSSKIKDMSTDQIKTVYRFGLTQRDLAR